VTNPSSLGEEIRRLRLAAGLTTADLSARSRVREPYLTAIEANREEPSVVALHRIVDQLDSSGAAFERLAKLLTAPELDWAGQFNYKPGPRSTPAVIPEDVLERPESTGSDTVSAAVRKEWQHKTDPQVMAAADSIDECSEQGQRAIRFELEQRGLDHAQRSKPAPDSNYVSGWKQHVDRRSSLEDKPTMSDIDTSAEPELQFDRVTAEPTGPAASQTPVVECSTCHRSITTEYYQIQDRSVCGRCRTVLESFAETPTGALPLIRAGLFGLGAGVAGAILYYAVIAIANIEIGIIAILIGYMVGRSVRKGAGGRGGLRFQILAASVTYASVAMAYTPVAFQAIAANQARVQEARTNASASAANAAATAKRRPRPTLGRFLLGIGMLAAFSAALPVLYIVGSLPISLISAFIIFIGMRQAWRMTAAPIIDVFGPYQIGAATTSVGA